MTTIRKLINQGKLKVGDSIHYTLPCVRTCTINEPEIKTPTVFMSINETRWSIHKILEDSIQILPTEEAINGELELEGIEGVYYGPSQMDRICRRLWSNKKIDATARSIHLEDFYGYKPEDYPDEKYVLYPEWTKKRKIKSIDGYIPVISSSTSDNSPAEFYFADYYGFDKIIINKFYRTPQYNSFGIKVTCNSCEPIKACPLNYDGHSFWIATDRKICVLDKVTSKCSMYRVDYGICSYPNEINENGKAVIRNQILDNTICCGLYQPARYDLLPLVEIPNDIKGEIDADGFWFKE